MNERIVAEMLGGPMDGHVLELADRVRYFETYAPLPPPTVWSEDAALLFSDAERVTYTDSGVTVDGRRLFTAPGYRIARYSCQQIVADLLLKATDLDVEGRVSRAWLAAAERDGRRVLDGPHVEREEVRWSIHAPDLAPSPPAALVFRASGYVLVEEEGGAS